MGHTASSPVRTLLPLHSGGLPPIKQKALDGWGTQLLLQSARCFLFIPVASHPSSKKRLMDGAHSFLSSPTQLLLQSYPGSSPFPLCAGGRLFSAKVGGILARKGSAYRICFVFLRRWAG